MVTFGHEVGVPMEAREWAQLPSLPYVHSRYLSRWALGMSPLSRKDIEL